MLHLYTDNDKHIFSQYLLYLVKYDGHIILPEAFLGMALPRANKILSFTMMKYVKLSVFYVT